MSSRRFSLSFLTGWSIVLLIALALRISLAASSPSASEYVGWLFLAIAPIATWAIIGRARSSGSIAHVLYDVEHAGESTETRPVTVRRG